MSSTKLNWADTVDSTSVLRSCLIAVYHCPLDKNQKRNARCSATGVSVQRAMGLTPVKIPYRLCCAKFVSFREIAIPVKQGYNLETRNAEMLIIQLIQCQMDIPDENWLDELCNPVTSGEFKGIYRSYATTLKQDVSNDILECTANESMSIDFFFKYFQKDLEMLEKLGCCAHYQMYSVKSSGIDLNKFEKESLRCRALYQNLQRLLDTQITSNVSLAKAPLQMGYCDITLWKSYEDPCCSDNKSRRLHHSLEKVCSCGLVSWNIKEKDSAVSRECVAYDSIRPILLHQLKEFLLQSFFRGTVVVKLKGTVQEIPPKKGKQENAYSIFIVDANDHCTEERVSAYGNLCLIIASSTDVIEKLLSYGGALHKFRIL